MPSAGEPGDGHFLFVWSLFHFSTIISPPFVRSGVLRSHLPRTAAVNQEKRAHYLPAWTFSRICGPTLTRQPSIASIVRPRMAPSPDMWTVLFRIDGSGDKLPSGNMGQKPKQVLVTVSGAASTFLPAHHRRGGDGDVGDFHVSSNGHSHLEQGELLGPD